MGIKAIVVSDVFDSSGFIPTCVWIVKVLYMQL